MSLKNSKKLQIKKQNQEEDIVRDFLKQYNYEYLKMLEQGDSSLVVVAFSQKLQYQVAVKIIKTRGAINQVNLLQVDKEIQILQNLQSEMYVLKIFEKIEEYNLGLLAIVMELCDCNLSNIFQLNTFSIKQIYAMAYQLLEGLRIYQEYGLIYSQIQPKNILYSKSQNKFLIVHYGFFKPHKYSFSQKKSDLPSISDISSEMTNEQRLKSLYSDVFSIGLILTEAFISRQLSPEELKNLKSQIIFNVFPFLNNYENIRFFDKILLKMIDQNQDLRLLPKDLLYNLKAFEIQDQYLALFKLKKYLKKLLVLNVEDIIKAIHYDVLEINLKMKQKNYFNNIQNTNN
ncbi:kinase domain protein (macronuclear) [Tetrahymena thermophila SB210]|uniref:Kinase domain protein n=1 Tax=Tetrahymena thermophila (strain SB210) TaxID=312017 RepID=Q22LG7_TETTS|nr:kinase domain protein [Tetrahymena thermophila SB210]EAR86173.2 kinase domain protein [Tetrahymena thermophila SB210]|eukprot:XP_976768.2 kinase domain protein [Tetrahymena thermophila SB210]